MSGENGAPAVCMAVCILGLRPYVAPPGRAAVLSLAVPLQPLPFRTATSSTTWLLGLSPTPSGWPRFPGYLQLRRREWSTRGCLTIL